MSFRSEILISSDDKEISYEQTIKDKLRRRNRFDGMIKV